MFILGKTSKIEQFIRPEKPLERTQKSNVMALLKKDLQSEDTSRTIARAIKAIIGAVYYDGGLDAARRMMDSLSLTIRGRGHRIS